LRQTLSWLLRRSWFSRLRHIEDWHWWLLRNNGWFWLRRGELLKFLFGLWDRCFCLRFLLFLLWSSHLKIGNSKSVQVQVLFDLLFLLDFFLLSICSLDLLNNVLSQSLVAWMRFVWLSKLLHQYFKTFRRLWRLLLKDSPVTDAKA
jgi:hypothetical protein